MTTPRITSEGDWEVALLSEAHSTFAGVVSPFLYSVAGDAPDQNIAFKSGEHFELFLIRLLELFVPGHQLVRINGQARDISLLDGLMWFVARYPSEAASTGLDRSLKRLLDWVSEERLVRFWCGELGKEIEIKLSRRDLIWFGGNCAKHGMLRLSNLLSKLEGRLAAAKVHLAAPELLAVLEELDAEISSRLEYHSTMIVELLGHVFASLNRVVLARFDENPTNHVRQMQMPAGVASDVFRNIYGSVLVFKRYDERNRILALTPVTSKYLQMRY